MAPPNRARQYGGGRGGFDLGALLLGAFGNGGAEELNQDFGKDEESLRAERGDWKSDIDTENPYKKSNWANRMLGGQGSAKNAEFKVAQIEQAKQQEFLRDMEKVKLANDLQKLGATTEAEKLLLGVRNKYATELEGLQNTNQLGQITAKGDQDVRGTKVQGKQQRKSQRNAADLLLKTDTNKSDLEARNTLSRQTGEANIGFGRFPGSQVTPEFEGLADTAAKSTFQLKPKMNEALLQEAQGKAARSGMYDIGGRGSIDLLSPNRTAFIGNEAVEADMIAGTPGRPASVTTQSTRILPKPVQVDTQDSVNLRGSPQSFTTRQPDAGMETREVMTNHSGNKMTISPKPVAAAQTIGLPEDYDTQQKRLRAKRTAQELLDLLGTSGGQWPPR